MTTVGTGIASDQAGKDRGVHVKTGTRITLVAVALAMYGCNRPNVEGTIAVRLLPRVTGQFERRLRPEDMLLSPERIRPPI